MRIVVEQRHIDKGTRRAPASCPVALALKEAGYNRVSVGRQTVGIGNDAYFASSRMQLWTRTFDDGKPVTPKAFNLLRRM